ncbi:tRNA 2'-phosphotransferase [Vanrija albida]|uniref:2'-phosphotransferase n=1 Tax=Vanrija albida TaxID=181172 RepID=A0ABR3Q510_9TREE
MAPRPNDSPDVKASKALSYILRHGAEKEGLHIRSDGLIKLKAVLARPRLKEVDEPTVFRIVEENAKKRFELQFGYDPSPPKPKKKPVPRKKKVPGAAVDAVAEQLAKATVAEPAAPAEPEWTELPFVSLPPPAEGEPSEPRGEWFIRATQGHSIALEGTGHLEPVLVDDAATRERVGLMVHGTRWELFETLKQQGLSKMNRQHVHLAPALKDHRILPRNGSTLLIYLDLPAMLASQPPIPVYTAANGVVLTPGDADGLVKKEYWLKAVHVTKGQHLVVWADGKDVVGVVEDK